MRIESRASWGAKHRDGVGNRPVGNLEVYLHHSVTATLSTNATIAQERAQMRLIEQIGQDRFGAGISYNLLVFPSGRVHVGASIGRIAYHSGAGRNVRGAAICLVGNFEANKMPLRMKLSVIALLIFGVIRGWWRVAQITAGHRQFSSTACPGGHAFAEIPDINRQARAGGSTSNPTQEKEFLMALKDNEQQRLLRRVDALYELIQPAQKDVRSSDGTLARWLRETTESTRVLLRTLSPGGQVRSMIEAGGGDLSPDAIATALADSIPDDLAERVVDKLADRLKR